MVRNSTRQPIFASFLPAGGGFQRTEFQFVDCRFSKWSVVASPRAPARAPGPAADRAAQAQLSGALANDHQHDVADAHDTGGEGRGAHEPDEHADAPEEVLDALDLLLGVVSADGVDVVGVNAVPLAQERLGLVLDLDRGLGEGAFRLLAHGRKLMPPAAFVR